MSHAARPHQVRYQRHDGTWSGWVTYGTQHRALGALDTVLRRERHRFCGALYRNKSLAQHS